MSRLRINATRETNRMDKAYAFGTRTPSAMSDQENQELFRLETIPQRTLTPYQRDRYNTLITKWQRIYS